MNMGCQRFATVYTWQDRTKKADEGAKYLDMSTNLYSAVEYCIHTKTVTHWYMLNCLARQDAGEAHESGQRCGLKLLPDRADRRSVPGNE